MANLAEDVDVAIIGGGVIGLSIAFHLLQAAPGLRVAVVDAGAASGGDLGQASYAAAGMLAPFAEAHGVGPFVRLGATSLSLYPEFVESIRQLIVGKVDNPVAITGDGMLHLTNLNKTAAHFRGIDRWLRDNGIESEIWEHDAVLHNIPCISEKFCFGLYSPHERQVDPRLLLISLRCACQRLGAHIYDSAPVSSIETLHTGLKVKADKLHISCANLVLAGGVWTSEIAAAVDYTPPVSIVKGQIFALKPDDSVRECLRYTLYTRGIYCVPRPDGRLIVGATEEPEAGFDTQTDAASIESLRQKVVDLVPALADAPIDGVAWAGLRPATPDKLPILGPLLDRPNVFVATGHFRNGILLAPVTGEIIAHQILHPSQPTHPLLDPAFRPERFAL